MSISQKEESKRRISEKLIYELGPVYELLRDPTVIEIMLNPDGELWVEHLGEPKKQFGYMDRYQAEGLMNTIASELDVEHTALNPILECELPLDGSRFAALLPPVVEGPSFAIRKRALMVFTLQDYVSKGIMTELQRSVIEAAVRDRKNILIAGGTGSGKTTLTNAVVQYIVDACPNDRLLIMEDTRELQCAAKNKVQMRAVEHVSMTQLLKTMMRFCPDRILVGEVRDRAALDLLKAWNTGHPGGAATIHADSAYNALLRIELLLKEATPGDMYSLVASAVNLIVFIEKHAGSRRITQILEIDGNDGQRYITRLIGEKNV
jgi:type IV secretion system protein VirB11